MDPFAAERPAGRVLLWVSVLRGQEEGARSPPLSLTRRGNNRLSLKVSCQFLA